MLQKEFLQVSLEFNIWKFWVIFSWHKYKLNKIKIIAKLIVNLFFYNFTEK